MNFVIMNYDYFVVKIVIIFVGSIIIKGKVS